MKVWNYMMIMLVMMVFLSFIGFAPTGSDKVLEKVGIKINNQTGALIEADTLNSDMANGEDDEGNPIGFWVLLSATSLAGALAVGYLTKSFEWKIVFIPFFVAFVYLFTSFGWGIVQLTQAEGESWLTAIIATIFLPLIGMFIFSLVEWFGGSPSD